MRLGCSTSVIYHWIHTGQLTARRGQGSRLCIPWNDQISASCQELTPIFATGSPPPSD